MSILKIITAPDPQLLEPSEELTPKVVEQSWLANFIKAMTETMLTKDGIGLAAPQVGENIRLIVVNTKYGPLAMLNPELTHRSFGKEWDEEGCLSVPNTFGQVKRHKKVRCQFLSAAGETKQIEASGLLARVIQHEIDHLDGILFIDKAKGIHEAQTL